MSATRILCGALLLPTVATVLGKVLFENVRSNFRRAILVSSLVPDGFCTIKLKRVFLNNLLCLQGGVAFITIKGVLRIYHKQQQYIRQCERKIVDFVEPKPETNPAAGDSRPHPNFRQGYVRPVPSLNSNNASNNPSSAGRS